MKNFVDAMREHKAFDYLTDYRQYSELTFDELRDIAKELVFAIENTPGINESDTKDIYGTTEQYLIARYDYEFYN